MTEPCWLLILVAASQRSSEAQALAPSIRNLTDRKDVSEDADFLFGNLYCLLGGLRVAVRQFFYVSVSFWVPRGEE